METTLLLLSLCHAGAELQDIIPQCYLARVVFSSGGLCFVKAEVRITPSAVSMHRTKVVT